jgi:hypothetical protein
MKKVIIAFTAIIAMASCKKENVTPTPDPTPIPGATKNMTKFSRVFDNGTPDVYEYAYDAQGRVAAIKDADRTNTFDFVSAASLVVTERFNSDNSVAAIRECTMNEKGYVTKIVIKNAVGSLQGTNEYSYNAEGYVTNYKLTYLNGSTMEMVYVISDGNAVSLKQYDNNVLSSSAEFTYDNNRINKTGFGITYYWSVPNLFGKCSKNMQIENKAFNAAGTLNWHTQSSFEFDAAGYPTMQTINYPLLGKQGVNTFSYQ